jgi:hypothetical protein
VSAFHMVRPHHPVGVAGAAGGRERRLGEGRARKAVPPRLCSSHAVR